MRYGIFYLPSLNPGDRADAAGRLHTVVGSAEEVRDKVAFVRERLRLTDVAGNFSLGNLPDTLTRATLRRFMEQVAPRI
ncbi:MAG: hypothetical protein ACREQV_25105 [Candidatus Binatia bacterium]